jgi:hypothetical protein
MKMKLLIASLMVTCLAAAKDPVFYQKGTLVKMESAECGVDSKGAEGIGGVLGVDDSSHTKTRQMLCQEYLLRGDKLEYRIRPKEEKHPALLPIGEKAEFRIQKDNMRLRVPELDNRERQFTVVAVSQRADVDNAQPTSAEVKAEK